MVGELRPDRIAAFLSHGPVDAIDRKKGERIAANIAAHFVERVRRGEQFIAFRRIDPINNRDG